MVCRDEIPRQSDRLGRQPVPAGYDRDHQRGDALLRARRQSARRAAASDAAAGKKSAKNFLQLKQAGLDAMSNALIDLEAQFPFNLTAAPSPGRRRGTMSGALFGIGRALYFCVPQNQTLLAYWDTVADRLFKIRNSENIQGVVQQLPLFDPPLDPGMLVKAAAAGIDIGSVVSGPQPADRADALADLIQKALELAGEVRSLGARPALRARKGRGRATLALLRQDARGRACRRWCRMCASCSGSTRRRPPMRCLKSRASASSAIPELSAPARPDARMRPTRPDT